MPDGFEELKVRAVIDKEVPGISIVPSTESHADGDSWYSFVRVQATEAGQEALLRLSGHPLVEAAGFLQIAVDHGKVAERGAERIRSMRSAVAPEDVSLVSLHARIAMAARDNAAGLLRQDLSGLSITSPNSYYFIKNLIEQAADALFNP